MVKRQLLTTKQAQCLLTYLGYDPGPIDGLDGPKTQAAMTCFKADYGESVDLLDAVAGEAAKLDKPENSASAPDTGEFLDPETRYFRKMEMRCPCGKCGGFPAEVNAGLIKALVMIREHFGAPVSIVPLPPADPHSGGSGVRCKAYNDSLKGSAKNSRHTQGKAADIRVKGFSGVSVKAYCDSLVKTGALNYCYIIGGGNSVHIDVR